MLAGMIPVLGAGLFFDTCCSEIDSPVSSCLHSVCFKLSKVP